MFCIIPKKTTDVVLEELLDSDGRTLTDHNGNEICTVKKINVWCWLWFKFKRK